MNKNLKGFTLIELLIVVAIIAILAAIAVPNFLEAQTRAKVSRAKADLRTLAIGLESYQVDNNKYPPGYLRKDGTLGNPTTTFMGIENVAVQINPRIERLAWITTPIAYLTSIVNDPFSVGVQDLGTAPGASLNTEFPVMTYWDPYYLDARKVSATANVDFEDMPEVLSQRGTYMLFSFGPDQVFEPAARFPQQRIYDSSNGTISDGDVLRHGGTQLE